MPHRRGHRRNRIGRIGRSGISGRRYHRGGGVPHNHPSAQNRMGPGQNPASNVVLNRTVTGALRNRGMKSGQMYGPIPSTGRHFYTGGDDQIHMRPNSAPADPDEWEWIISHMKRGGRVPKKHLGGPVHNHPHRAKTMNQPRGRGISSTNNNGTVMAGIVADCQRQHGSGFMMSNCVEKGMRDNASWHNRKGGKIRNKRQMGGRTTCPPGQHMMPDGSCMQGNTHPTSGGGYRKGGRMRRMRRGGRTRRR